DRGRTRRRWRREALRGPRTVADPEGGRILPPRRPAALRSAPARGPAGLTAWRRARCRLRRRASRGNRRRGQRTLPEAASCQAVLRWSADCVTLATRGSRPWLRSTSPPPAGALRFDRGHPAAARALGWAASGCATNRPI